MRFHILGLPHTITNADFCACAYTQKVRKFAKMMANRGHIVIHYGHPDSEVPWADESVGVISRETFDATYGDHDYQSKFFKFSTDDQAYKEFYANTIAEIWRRKEKGDFILPFWGWGHKAICDAHPDSQGTFTVEPGIGYSSGHFASYKIFESYSLYHAYCGLESSANCRQNWYEVVIPNYFDLSEFDYCEEKDDYLLFLGRVYEGKGIHVALQMAAHTGIPLKVAGQNIPEFLEGYSDPIPKNVEFLGYAGIEERKRLMAKAKGFILASKYIEPFGGTMVEALLSGTPCITTDWGAMAENNLHGLTGYRCRTFDHFIWAAKNIGQISSKDCRQWGENFSLERIAPMYEEFFQMVHDQAQPKNWYTLRPDRADLDWMTKTYPGQEKKKPRKVSAYNWNLMVEEETPNAQSLATWLIKKELPRKAVDIGSGPGHWANALRAVGIPCDAYDLEFEGEGVDPWDITADPLPEKYDIALCLEVAEHISEDHAETVARNVAASVAPGGWLIWSAAHLGQVGIGHVNCQPKEYWIELLCNNGMAPRYGLTEDLLQHVRKAIHMGWFVQNVIVLEKR